MRPFEYAHPETETEALELLADHGGNTAVLAGGTDLLSLLKRDLLQPARADPVRALFVFLHLLECQTERVAELLLTHPEHHAAHPYTSAHVLVGGIGRLLSHHVVLSSLVSARLMGTN